MHEGNALAYRDSCALKSHSYTQMDYYDVLGLSDMGALASPDDLRKAYRKLSLIHHPDRNDGDDGKFKDISRAYSVLSDTDKRRVIDSHVDAAFDDIPAGDEEGDFYEIYGPVFTRFSRWSTTQPVPRLGNDEDDMQDIDNFYNFWTSFISWRIFPQEDDHDLEEADCREERRWMKKENEKLQKKLKKGESGKIRKLVERAMTRDPRIKRAKTLDKEEKERVKEERRQSRKR